MPRSDPKQGIGLVPFGEAGLQPLVVALILKRTRALQTDQHGWRLPASSGAAYWGTRQMPSAFKWIELAPLESQPLLSPGSPMWKAWQ